MNQSRTFLQLLVVVWGAALAVSIAQVAICEVRAGTGQKCAQEWQLALATPMGLGQTLFSLFQQPPN